MWVLLVPLAVVGILIVYGLVTDIRMRRIRKQAPPLTDAYQRNAEVTASLGSRSRARRTGRLFAAFVIGELLGFFGRG